jgi:hypothetical protein
MNKRLIRLGLCLIAVLGLTVALISPVSAGPAQHGGMILTAPANVTVTDVTGKALPRALDGAFYLPPYGTVMLTFGPCTQEFTYGQYGDAYAEIRAWTLSCSTWSTVQVTSVLNGQLVSSRHCSKFTEYVVGYPDCAIFAGGIGLRAFRSGNLFSGHTSICYVPYGQDDVYPPCSALIGFVVFR